MFILSLLLLLILIIFYFHFSIQFKKPKEPFDIYETTYESNEQINKLNTYKKPFLFKINNLCPLTFASYLNELETIISLIDMNNFYNNEKSILELPLNKCISITTYLPNYNCIGYIHSNEIDNWNTIIDEFNDILSPKGAFVSNKLGVMFGSINSHSIPEYHTQTSKYLIVLSGEITVKITSIRNSERLDGKKFKQKIINSSNSFFTHFYSDTTNLWNNQNIKLKKIPFLEFNISNGYALSIPSYTVFTISYNQPGTFVLTIDYINFINSIANIWNWYNYKLFIYNNYNNIDDNNDIENNIYIENNTDIENNIHIENNNIEKNNINIEDNLDK